VVWRWSKATKAASCPRPASPAACHETARQSASKSRAAPVRGFAASAAIKGGLGQLVDDDDKRDGGLPAQFERKRLGAQYRQILGEGLAVAFRLDFDRCGGGVGRALPFPFASRLAALLSKPSRFVLFAGGGLAGALQGREFVGLVLAIQAALDLPAGHRSPAPRPRPRAGFRRARTRCKRRRFRPAARSWPRIPSPRLPARRRLHRPPRLAK